MTQYYLQQLINGLMLGSLYALVAIGFSMIYGIVRLINFAHGDVVMIGAFATLALVAAGTPWLLVAPVVLLTGVLAGISIERVVFRPIRGAPQVTGFIATLALSVMIENGVVMLLSPQPRNFLFPDVMRARVPIGPATVSVTDLVIIGTTLVLVGVLVLIVRRTRLGMAMRATFQDRDTAALMGVRIGHVHTVTFAFGSALAAAAGALLGPIFLAYPSMGDLASSKAFCVVILGGLGNLAGATLGGLLLGIAEEMGAGYVSSGYRDAVGFVIIILVLLFRPSGLFARTERIG